jgi:hypothetical protein
MATQFLSRPVTGAAQKCLDDFLNTVKDVLEQNPDCAHELLTAVNRDMGNIRRSMAAKGPKSREGAKEPRTL